MCMLSSQPLPAGMATKSTFYNHLSSAFFVFSGYIIRGKKRVQGDIVHLVVV